MIFNKFHFISTSFLSSAFAAPRWAQGEVDLLAVDAARHLAQQQRPLRLAALLRKRKKKEEKTQVELSGT